MDGKIALLGLTGFLIGLASAFLAGVVTMGVMVSHSSEAKSQTELPVSSQGVFVTFSSLT